MYLQLLILHFYHLVIEKNRFIFDHSVLANILNRARTELFKKIGKRRSKKSKRSDIKYFLTIDFLTESTKNCANFVGIFAHLSDLYSPMTKLCKSEI